jgi:hypothetical protein
MRSRNRRFALCSSTMDYTCHLDSLELMSLYEFTSSYKKVPSLKHLPFKEPHPQQHSHSIKAHKFRQIVNIIGPRLPDILSEDLSIENRNIYCQMLLIFHKPFQSLPDLIMDKIYWEDVFQSHIPSPEIQRYIENCEDYYVGMK